MKIDNRHPRYLSLTLREKLVDSVATGITSQAGLIAHGRGEAFDYLLGEKTHDFAKRAIRAGAAYLLLAKMPIISVNGNTAALCAKEILALSKLLDCKIEVNLFHYSKERVKKIEAYFKKIDGKTILTSRLMQKIKIPEIASKRAIVLREGIGKSDCVLVPLEDGDRAQALRRMGKNVIAIDLNPRSRTAECATVTIVDNIVRCLAKLSGEIRKLRIEDIEILRKIITKYDNKKILEEAVKRMSYDKRSEQRTK